MSNFKDTFVMVNIPFNANDGSVSLGVEIQQVKPINFKDYDLDTLDTLEFPMQELKQKMLKEMAVNIDALIIKDAITKAKMYDMLSSDLGCPLDVVFKALKEGAYFKTDYYGINITYHILEKHEIDFKNNRFDIRKEDLVDNKPYYTGGFIFNFKDYGNTWFLKGDRENEED